jgi:hypothetical protein
MARQKKKAEARLEQRQRQYDSIPVDKRRGTKRPGSTNNHQR